MSIFRKYTAFTLTNLNFKLHDMKNKYKLIASLAKLAVLFSKSTLKQQTLNLQNVNKVLTIHNENSLQNWNLRQYFWHC